MLFKYSIFLLLLLYQSSMNTAKVIDDVWTAIERSREYYTKHGGAEQDSTFSLTSKKVVDGDIVLDKEDEMTLLSPKRTLYPRFRWHQRLWGRVIPYIIRPQLLHAKSKFLKAFARIEKASCLKFRPYRPSDKDWMEYLVGDGCSSAVGRRYHTRGRRIISIGKYCDSVSTILHETLHCLGFWHEQNRDDRDSFVTVYENRISAYGSDQFWKSSIGRHNYFGTPYDYYSVMQYSNRAFVKPNIEGNVIEAKFDPNIQLGGVYMSSTDKIELNKLYQCHVYSGWSDWSEWSQCLPNTAKICTSASVRFCVDSDWRNCPGGNIYGVQNKVVECDPTKCAGGLAVNGNWGKWGAYTLCDSKCGWGIQTRYRQCNNPTPKNNGKKCEGSNREKHLCRRPRCGRPNGADNNFDYGKRGWTFKGFEIKSGKAAYINSGPTGDHTSIVTGRAGKYALASKIDSVYRIRKAEIVSPVIQYYQGKKCLMFYYQLNGAKIYHDRALALYVQEQRGRYLNFAFSRGGHQGNYWKRAAMDISGIRKPFQIGIMAKFQLGRADIAIDDIFFDHMPCHKGLSIDSCKDLSSNCEDLAKKGECKINKHKMIRECCKSCSNPAFDNWKPTVKPFVCRDDHHKDCNLWFLQGECLNNKSWMEKNCCVTCKKRRICNKDRLTNNKENANCQVWASIGECIRNPKYMLYNCCKSCQESKCIDKYKSCRGWGTLDYCFKKKKPLWFQKNCCKTCLALRAPKICKATKNNDKSCEEWAKRGECRKNSWMSENCCPACKKYA